jgi:hemolysin III
MDWLIFREPVSAWTHGIWMIFALVGCLLLWQVGRGDPVKQAALLLYGICLVLCLGGSALYHGVRLPAQQIRYCRMIDHIGIFLLIGGTVTPVALVVLTARWRTLTLAVAWGGAAFGIALLTSWSTAPLWLYTSIYLVMGWGVCLGYFEIARVLSRRAMRPVWLGGWFYTVGALLNLVGWPRLVPGVFGTHELFHLFVMAGSLCHFYFMVRWLAPYPRAALQPSVATVSARPVLAHAAAQV